MSEVDKALKELGKAGAVAFGGVGIVGKVLPETEAYQWLEAASEHDGAALSGKLEKLVKKGSPAGRIYAALLLERIDPEAGRHAWQRLADDEAEVTTFSGCIMDTTTVARWALAHAANGR